MSVTAKAIAAAAGLICIMGGASWYAGAFDSALVKRCEAMLLDRLKAPSQYQRVNIREYTSSISEDEVWSRLLDQWDRATDARSQLAQIRNHLQVSGHTWCPYITTRRTHSARCCATRWSATLLCMPMLTGQPSRQRCAMMAAH